MNSAEITIRPAILSDAAEILEIYAPYVKETAITFEYDVPTIQEFTDRIKQKLGKYPYIVAVTGGKIAGYAYASAFRPRAAYDRAVETTIYIKTDCKGKGIGKRLYLFMEEILKAQNIKNLYACIAYPNPESIGFHERLGYKTIGHFSKCGYKLGNWYDMIWMEKFIGEHTGEPEHVLPYYEVESRFFRASSH